jgi:ABC-type lipoprotein export system ATPase subunit
MDKIILHHVLPHVFAQSNDLQSDVWKQDLNIAKDKLYLIEADSGQGKSTFCSYITGYRHDYSGEIYFDNTDTKSLKVKDWTEIRRRHVSHLFQELRLFPELTALENVQIKNNITGWKSEGQIKEWFERLGISDKLSSKIGQMSFGQQQRVAMIRSLVQPFDFLLVDEPISHLDDSNAAIMAQIMIEEARRQEAGIIVTSIGKHMDLPYDNILHL